MDEIVSSKENPEYFQKYKVNPMSTIERPLAQFYKNLTLPTYF
jgi:hypothetical protein